MKNYYDILGLSQHADIADIKKAYRKKALLYHPDRNSSSDAQQKFIEITEAYEMLLQKRENIPFENLTQQKTTSPYNSFAEELLKQARARAEEAARLRLFRQREQRRQIAKAQFETFYNYFKLVALASALFSLALIMDNLMSGNALEETIDRHAFTNGHADQLITVNRTIFLNSDDYYAHAFHQITISESLIFRKVKSFTFGEEQYRVIHFPNHSIFQFAFIQCMWFFAAISYFFVKKAKSVYLISTIICICAPCNFVILMVS